MTTAHRPTWHPVKGGRDQGGNRVMVLSKQYSSKDLPGHTTLKYRKIGQGAAEEVSQIDFKQQILASEKANQAQITEQPDVSDEYSSDQDDSQSSDFSEEELRREIEKIKAERLEKEKIENQKQEIYTKQSEELLKGNPEYLPGFALKRKWTEEVIFRNQSRDEPKEKQRFVNDTVRSDFHRKILRKYIL
jgi:protein CWC15